MLPDSIFFKPKEQFIHELAAFIKAEDWDVVDCGAGVGLLSKLLIESGIKCCPIDIFPRENPLTEVHQIDALNFPFAAGMLAIIARPCHGDWVQDVILKAVENGAQAMYIGLKKNFKHDIVGLGLAHYIFSKNAGEDGEYAIVFRKREIKGSMLGGYLKDVPHGALKRRKFKSDNIGRYLSVSLTKYTGVGQHYYVSVREESNPLWNEKDQRWQKFWDDTEADGFSDHNRFNTLKQVEQYFKKIKRKFKNHSIELPEEDIKYYYGEGG